jgi:peptidoglycan/xylan/chitin deacetylase (PgdA/CDA1 family)
MTVPKLLVDNPLDPSAAVTSLAVRSDAARLRRSTVLAYHELAAEEVAYHYALSCRQLEDHLGLASLIRSESTPSEERLVISFDDGHISHYELALPLLEKYSSKAIFFVIAGRIGKREDFMTWSHLKELIALGHRVEAHGWSHAFLTSCTDAELRNEVRGSKEMIEDRLGDPVSSLSVPHGRWNSRVVKACEEAGYRQLYTSNPWISRRDEGRLEVIGRLVVVQSMNVEQLLHWLTMGSTEAALHRAKQNLKDSVRYLLGDRLYYRMWSRFSKWSGPEDYAPEEKVGPAG